MVVSKKMLSIYGRNCATISLKFGASVSSCDDGTPNTTGGATMDACEGVAGAVTLLINKGKCRFYAR
jgi:hypothetical protein